MNKKPLVIIGSARRGSETEKLVDSFFLKPQVVKVNLLDLIISPYNYEGEYPSADNFLSVIDIIIDHQKIVLATPVYWYAMSGIMKTFFDRLTDLTTTEKDRGRKMKGKEIFLLAVGTDPALPEGFETPFRLTSGYLCMNFISSFYCAKTQLDGIRSNGFGFVNTVIKEQ